MSLFGAGAAEEGVARSSGVTAASEGIACRRGVTAAGEGAARRCRPDAVGEATARSSKAVAVDDALAQRLCELTSEFYRANAESFSQTRQAPWQGWERVLAAAGVADADEAPGAPEAFLAAKRADAKQGERDAAPFCVLDLACGNLRFERYLAEQVGASRLACFAVDNCDPLVDQAQPTKGLPPISFQNLNVIEALAAGNLAAALAAPDASCDLAVSFGFMHHIPRERWRVALLRALAAKTRPGGHVAVSFWRFLNSEKLAKKARATTAQARNELGIPALPPNDFLLGWQNTSGLYRYCHHFDEPEIERLLAAIADVAQPAVRFAADGKTGNLNEYVILRVR